MSWKAVHACVRGSSHQRSGLPNQDAAQCTVAPGAQGTVAVAVVSDGHGSPRHFRSQIGSSLAVSTVAGTLQGFLRESVASNGQVPFVPEQVHELERKIVSGWLAAVHADLERNPFTQAELATLERQDGMEGRAAVEKFAGACLRRHAPGSRSHRQSTALSATGRWRDPERQRDRNNYPAAATG